MSMQVCRELRARPVRPYRAAAATEHTSAYFAVVRWIRPRRQMACDVQIRTGLARCSRWTDHGSCLPAANKPPLVVPAPLYHSTPRVAQERDYPTPTI